MPESNELASGDAPRIFFSYASEDLYWVTAFKKWFRAGDEVRVLDYAADEIPYDSLKEALDEQVRQSAVVVAFVSAEYRRKQWTVAEWEQALTEAQRRHLIFVPMMLDADAKVWWRQRRNDGKLGELSLDYQYEDFTDGSGRRIEINDDDTRVTGKIVRLAQKIKRDLESAFHAPNGRDWPKDSDLSPGPQANRGTNDGISASSGAESASPGVVVLGHPSAALPPEYGDGVRKLCAALAAGDIRTQIWGDGWRKNSAARGKIGSAVDAIFVQPVSAGEASDRIADPGAIGKYLDEAAIHGARVVLWLPQGYRDPDFEAAAKAASDSGQFPIPRMDGADQLADWLRGLRNRNQPIGETRIQVQTMGSLAETTPEQAILSQKIVEQLQGHIASLADQLVDNPKPTPPPWPFWDSQFNRQIRMFGGNRTIVAIHDLDVRPGNDRAVEKQLQIKFEAIQKAIDEEQETRTRSGKPRLNAFLTALLVNNAEALPFGKYPDDGRYSRWCLLGFAPPADLLRSESSPLKPDPASLAVFRTNLLAWAHSVQ